MAAVVATLQGLSSRKTLAAMDRFAIPSKNALGVPVGQIRDLGKRLGRSHELAVALWKTGIYEARMLAAFVAEPARVTPAQMDRWRRDFDNWAICDHLCFHLFDRTPHAFAKAAEWSGESGEFQKRAGFALLASLALHDKRAHSREVNKQHADGLLLIEREANDGRNFVKKAVSWALRSIGRRNLELRAAAGKLAERLAGSTDSAARWVGKDALRDLAKSAKSRLVVRRKPART